MIQDNYILIYLMIMVILKMEHNKIKINGKHFIIFTINICKMILKDTVNNFNQYKLI